MRLHDLEPEDDPPPRTPPRDHYARVPLAAGLGWVGADAAGQLTEVHLDTVAMRSMSQAGVTGYLVEAVNAVGDAVARRLVEERRQLCPATR